MIVHSAITYLIKNNTSVLLQTANVLILDKKCDEHRGVKLLLDPRTMFPLYRLAFHSVVKTNRYNGNRMRFTTLYNERCLVEYDFFITQMFLFFYIHLIKKFVADAFQTTLDDSKRISCFT